MDAYSIYLVQLSETYVELFSESATGILDFAAIIEEDEAPTKARAAAVRLMDTSAIIEEKTLWKELRFQDSWGQAPLYEAQRFRPRVQRLGPTVYPGMETASFFLRYPTWRRAFREGNFIEAGEAIRLSKKLKSHRPLLRWAAGDEAFLIFALAWLQSFEPAKEEKLTALLAGKETRDNVNPYAELFDFAKPTFESSEIAGFRKEIASKLRRHLLDKAGSIVLPVVGEGFGHAGREMRRRSGEALAEGRRRALTEGLAGAETRVRAWLESVELTVQPEPWNKADPRAVSVLARFPEDGRTELAGYLRRDVAAFVSPILEEGARLEAKLWRLGGSGEEEFSIAIQAGQHNQ